ncbi:MAG: peptidylprolyl isomerase [Anaerolineaceae bacterium]|nr:peptidylprolyl isomerase [Anaerolineaceae bacterium]
MSKRSQTTGVPKNAPKKSPAAANENQGKQKLKPEYHSRAEREAEIQRRILIGAGIILALVVIILLGAFVVEQFVVPNQAVASVNGETISVSEFQKRVRLERYFLVNQLNSIINTMQSFGMSQDQINQQLTQEPYNTMLNEYNIPDQLGNRVLNTMIDDVLVRQLAAEREITVSDADVQAQIDQYVGYDPEAILAAGQEPTATIEPTVTPTPFVSPTPSPTPTITPTLEFTTTPTSTPFATIPPTATLSGTEEYNQAQDNIRLAFTELRTQASIGDSDIRAYFEIVALRQALQDDVTSDLTLTTPFANTRHILVATEEEAQDVLTALQNGGSFSDLARAVSLDTGSGASGGELGWAPIFNYVKPFADAISTAEIGAFVGPVQTDFGYHIIQVRGREDREVTQSQLDSAKNNEFSQWLTDQRDAEQENIQIFDIWTQYVPQ